MGALFKAGRVSGTVIKPAPGFRAELPGLDLATLVQMTCARHERQVVRVSSYGEEGYLYSSGGKLVHATVGDLVGDEAVLRVLSWFTGDFAICDRPFPLHPTVSTSTEGLLLRAAARLDEARAASEHDGTPKPGLAEELEGEDPEDAIADEPTALQPAFVTQSYVRASLPPPPPPSARPVTWPIDDASHQQLPPVSLETPTRRMSRPPLPRPVARPDPDLLASVRLDARGTVVSTYGADDQLAQLVAYVNRVAALVQEDFALDPFDALHAELSGKRVLIYREDGALVGVIMKPSSAAQELRQRLGV